MLAVMDTKFCRRCRPVAPITFLDILLRLAIWLAGVAAAIELFEWWTR